MKMEEKEECYVDMQGNERKREQKEKKKKEGDPSLLSLLLRFSNEIEERETYICFHNIQISPPKLRDYNLCENRFFIIEYRYRNVGIGTQPLSFGTQNWFRKIQTLVAAALYCVPLTPILISTGTRISIDIRVSSAKSESCST